MSALGYLTRAGGGWKPPFHGWTARLHHLTIPPSAPSAPLREFFPKDTDFRIVEQKELDQAQYLINERPRKKLDFSTPKVEFYKRL